MKLPMFLLVTLVALPFAAFAGVININSDLVSEGNDVSGTNVFIPPHPGWQPNLGTLAQWISYGPTGYGAGQTSPPNASPLATFYEDFTIPLNAIGPITGFINVWADDTASVFLDGVLLYAANISQDGACAAGPIGCQPSEGALINLGALSPGAHRLTFEVHQLGLATFGLLYQGEISFREPLEIPEPSTFALLGLGLLGLGLAGRRRLK